jgi:hypothetical protein
MVCKEGKRYGKGNKPEARPEHRIHSIGFLSYVYECVFPPESCEET